MTEALQNDHRLIDVLVPQFPVGCRRITPGVGYLPALHKGNVEVVTEAIEQVVANGLKTSSGKTYEVDAIICATGFDVGFIPRFPLVGRNGNLQDEWSQEFPSAYMSCAVPKLPNYFSVSTSSPHLSSRLTAQCSSGLTPQLATAAFSRSQSI